MPDESILKAFGMLAGIVAVFAFILIILKKYTKKSKQLKNQIDLQVLSRLSLSQKNNLYLIKAGDETFLIGANDHHISTLADLSPKSEAKAQKSGVLQKQGLKNSQSIDDSLSFSSFIRSAFKKNEN